MRSLLLVSLLSACSYVFPSAEPETPEEPSVSPPAPVGRMATAPTEDSAPAAAAPETVVAAQPLPTDNAQAEPLALTEILEPWEVAADETILCGLRDGLGRAAPSVATQPEEVAVEPVAVTEEVPTAVSPIDLACAALLERRPQHSVLRAFDIGGRRGLCVLRDERAFSIATASQSCAAGVSATGNLRRSYGLVVVPLENHRRWRPTRGLERTYNSWSLTPDSEEEPRLRRSIGVREVVLGEQRLPAVCRSMVTKPRGIALERAEEQCTLLGVDGADVLPSFAWTSVERFGHLVSFGTPISERECTLMSYSKPDSRASALALDCVEREGDDEWESMRFFRFEGIQLVPGERPRRLESYRAEQALPLPVE